MPGRRGRGRGAVRVVRRGATGGLGLHMRHHEYALQHKYTVSPGCDEKNTGFYLHKWREVVTFAMHSRL